MPATLIGQFLDAALDAFRFRGPSEALDILRMAAQGTIGGGLSHYQGARLLLANQLLSSQLPRVPIDPLNEDDADLYQFRLPPCSTYRELVRSLYPPTIPRPLTQFDEAAAPDFVPRDRDGRLSAAVEVGYGFKPASARAAVDRLLHFAWASYGSKQLSWQPTVAYVFLYEIGHGEIIRDTARQIDDWIGENYGPFNGIDRLRLPMMPILTRSAKRSAMGPRVSLIDPSISPTGYAAFCISYEDADI